MNTLNVAVSVLRIATYAVTAVITIVTMILLFRYIVKLGIRDRDEQAVHEQKEDKENTCETCAFLIRSTKEHYECSKTGYQRCPPPDYCCEWQPRDEAVCVHCYRCRSDIAKSQKEIIELKSKVLDLQYSVARTLREQIFNTEYKGGARRDE